LVDLQLTNPKSAISHQTHRSKGGKGSTLSNSPKRKDGSSTARIGSSANYHRKQKSFDKSQGGTKKTKHCPQQQTSSDSKGVNPSMGTGSGSSKKASNNISDLHLFIKTIERDLSEKFKNY